MGIEKTNFESVLKLLKRKSRFEGLLLRCSMPYASSMHYYFVGKEIGTLFSISPTTSPHQFQDREDKSLGALDQISKITLRSLAFLRRLANLL